MSIRPDQLRFELIDQEATPLGQLTLHRYAAPDGQTGFEVRIDDAFLMASAQQRSSAAAIELGAK